ncbi:YbaN family protein [Methanospirillum hungatei]|jgi:uncharacterized membrane protein YbaN (DUF454 family)|uniref:YbaN family protein n=1 Tax=Methanospirillum hungatei TaxID=2203 RepID=UPI0009C4D773|nr:YbaN family protein [Methanospirillum hungatei]OQA54025.1 MAG: hypothetical protein BWY45_02738 [Euryarchaeota archaeon ADurb.Bin294]HOW04059.1 YbaN family protein [Methanospirillum hungatei]
MIEIPEKICLVPCRYARIGYTALGTVFVITAVIGIFLPLLPTTPFLLLAVLCYARGSERFYTWIMHHRVFGQYISQYTSGKGMSLKSRIGTILLLWVVIGCTILFWIRTDIIRIILLIIALSVSIGLYTMKPQPWNLEKE